MTGIDHVELEQVIVHKVGNPSRGEELKLSINPLTLNDEIVQGLLTKYFLGAFNENEFDIHLSAVKKQQRVFKTVLKLDKNFHIYIHGRRDLIERGIDEMSGKKFYKIYYEEET